MTDIELTYFPVHGYRGLMTRLVLNFSGIEYSEKIVGIKEWPMKKGGEFKNGFGKDANCVDNPLLKLRNLDGIFA